MATRPNSQRASHGERSFPRFTLLASLALVVAAAASVVVPLSARAAISDETEEQKDARMEWWRDARFGMFIHWGLYAIPAGEWDGKTNHAEWIRHSAQIPMETYDKFVDQFNPIEFDADEWARMAKDAGMKYMVITSKHHDGFCLWPSEHTEYDIESTPFKRDILGELTEACRKHGVRMCFYHSIMDWHHPNYPRRGWEKDRADQQVDMDKYTAYMKAQLKELIERYDPAVLWFDGEWEGAWTHERGVDLYEYVRSLKPDIIVNNRVDKGRRGMQGMTKDSKFRGDFGTPEQEIPHTGMPGVDWESCMTMNRHWGWNKNDKAWKSSTDLIRKLVDITSKGGNFLLNIGPKADGTFPDAAVERLAAIGDWMDVNGESIYGTSASPFKHTPWGRCTTKNEKLYLHVFDWPKDGRLVVSSLKATVKRAYLLADADQESLTVEPGDAGPTITLPEEAPDPVDSVIVVELAGPVDLSARPVAADEEGVVILEADRAIVHGTSAKYESGADRDCIGFWTNAKDWVEWKARADRPGTYAVKLTYAVEPPGGSEFTVEVAGQELSGVATATGGWGQFKTIELGEIRIDEAGNLAVAVRPKSLKGAGVMNLKRITLEPK